MSYVWWFGWGWGTDWMNSVKAKAGDSYGWFGRKRSALLIHYEKRTQKRSFADPIFIY